jgi:4,5-DOPA dioxygenase extradiol
MSEILPAIFFGHGNPMNALMNNLYTEGWQAVGRSIPTPKAILSISAHWYVPGTGVTISTAPEPFTILVAFRQSYIGFSILLREILS